MRGEWIEIYKNAPDAIPASSLPKRGEWIEICRMDSDLILVYGLSPCGESGLKLPALAHGFQALVSPHAGRVD